MSDISDKLGVLLAEIAEQEELFAQNLEDSRGVLKQIRNTESSVQPSRTHKLKVRHVVRQEAQRGPRADSLRRSKMRFRSSSTKSRSPLSSSRWSRS